METMLFVLSFTIVIHYFIKAISVILGNPFTVPVPLLHLYGIGFTNTYILTPALIYQIYFWTTYFKIID